MEAEAEAFDGTKYVFFQGTAVETGKQELEKWKKM